MVAFASAPIAFPFVHPPSPAIGLLFLIPVPWIGPVLAPVVVSVCLIGTAITLEVALAKRWELKPHALEWALVIAAGLIVIVSFCLDWRSIIEGGLPGSYDWWLFAVGLGLALVVFIRRMFIASRG